MVTRRFSPELTRHAYPAGWMLMWWPMQAGLEDPITGWDRDWNENFMALLDQG